MINSSSPSPSFAHLDEELENDATACLCAGFHDACNNELRDVVCLIAEAESRETVLGALRAKDLIENMIGNVVEGRGSGMVDEKFVC